MYACVHVRVRVRVPPPSPPSRFFVRCCETKQRDGLSKEIEQQLKVLADLDAQREAALSKLQDLEKKFQDTTGKQAPSQAAREAQQQESGNKKSKKQTGAKKDAGAKQQPTKGGKKKDGKGKKKDASSKGNDGEASFGGKGWSPAPKT